VLGEHESLWVIGGGAVYDAFLPHAGRLVVTEVDLAVDGDTWAPVIGDGWRRVSRTPDDGWSRSSTGLAYAVTEYARVPVGGAE
jgi:dihydrofolate reductase